MAIVQLRNENVNTSGNLPATGDKAPAFTLTNNDLVDISLDSYLGKHVILNIFPSIDTRTCATSVREFNKRAAALPGTVILCIAKDLPFAMKRFCGAEGIDNVITLSDFRHTGFGADYGVTMMDGGMRGLFARAVVVIDPQGNVKYTELVPTIGQEPDYEGALKVISEA